MRQHKVFYITESSIVGELRRYITSIAKTIGFDEEKVAKLGIISNEISTNILKHSKSHGEVLIRKINLEDNIGIEILGIDNGCGIKNIKTALEDGFSTAGSMGTGLGAIKRLSDEFDIYSQVEKGTVILSRFWKNSSYKNRDSHNLDIGLLSIPKPGQEVCGDDLFIKIYNGKYIVCVVDGLGHGIKAYEASQRAVNIFKESNKDIEIVLSEIHKGLISTRGAVASIASIDLDKDIIEYVGVGNISGRILYDDKIKTFISYPGTLGAFIGNYQKIEFKHNKEFIMIMNSDGLCSNINLQNYPGLLSKDTSVIAGVLYKDFSRRNDDTTIVVMRSSKRR